MTSAPSLWIASSELSCLLCGRVAATVQGDDHDATYHVVNPLHAEHVRRRTCPACGGRLMLGGAEYVTLPRRLLTSLEIAQPAPRRRRTDAYLSEAERLEAHRVAQAAYVARRKANGWVS